MARYRIPLRGPHALIIGVVCLGIGFYQVLTSSTLAQDGVVAEATVVDRDSWRKKRQTRYRLTLEFTDRQGTDHREQTDYSTGYGHYQRGETVAIRYNPYRPEEFAIDSFRDLWFGPFAWCGFGLLACTAFLFGPRRA